MIELPLISRDIIKDLGYDSLYPTQEDAIKAGVLEGVSMLIATPTASGKTLIALLASAMYITKQKVIYITPLKALANEKYEEFKILEKYGAKVMISTSDLSSTSSYLHEADVIILTNEKLDSLMRHGVEWLNDTRLFIIDEVHMLANKHRGATLEIIISKILTYYNEAQLLALSATISNAEEIASWLGCKLISSDWRPVPLKEGVYNQGEIIFKDDRIKVIQSNRGASIDLAIDCIANHGQALIFTETRKKAVSIALKAAEIVNKYLNSEDKMKTKSIANAILENEDTELASNLAFAISNGVAFHHAGLSYSCRKIVEHYYREGLIKLITTTPTLAAGVNLPARRVIINSIRRFDVENGMEEISIMEYKQMCGRAGRPRYDNVGEAIIVSNEPEYIFDAYIDAKPEDIRSTLLEENNMKMHLLGIIASLPAIDKEELLELLKNTFMARYYRLNTIKSRLEKIIDYLLVNDLIIEKKSRYIASETGRLASNFYLHPETAILFNSFINKGEANDLSLLHMITESYDFSPKIALRSKDYELYDENLIDKEYNRSLLVLYAWINEHSERFILERYDVEPGDLYRMVENAEWLLHAFTELARKNLDLMRRSSILRERVKYGIKEELIELVSIKDIGRIRARALYNAGIKSRYDIKSISMDKLASIPKIGHVLARKLKELEK